MPHIKSGQLKAFAFAGASRSPLLPEVPTFAEAGIHNFAARAWHGLFAPRNTPREVTDILSRAVWANVSSSGYSEDFLVLNGFDVKPSISIDQFAAFVANDQVRYEALMKQLNLPPMTQK